MSLQMGQNQFLHLSHKQKNVPANGTGHSTALPQVLASHKQKNVPANGTDKEDSEIYLGHISKRMSLLVGP